MTSAAPILTGTGSISRLTFLISGLLLAMFKQGLDIGLSVLAFHRTVRAFNYWFPFDRAVALTSLGAADSFPTASAPSPPGKTGLYFFQATQPMKSGPSSAHPGCLRIVASL